MSFSSVFRRAALAPASAARAFSTTTPRPLAKITIVGNLADTPEVHPTSTGREVLRYAVASNSGRGENRKTSWFKVTSFAEGAQRDYLMNLPKGATVYVEGDASLNTYTDSAGQNRTNFSVVQRNLEVLRRPQSSEQGE
ncbi:related to single-stranded DNA-binding protein [Fusarium torulosum]|uniref:Related to single-stranded DNA-binding protein n=1 Tax=Fusarium torulosum TaxID=33205 RepID=A0AAE8MJ91_9HYPO|nr:related to single-stranded DNA-binding protein [Fusarium torulosum]